MAYSVICEEGGCEVGTYRAVLLTNGVGVVTDGATDACLAFLILVILDAVSLTFFLTRFRMRSARMGLEFLHPLMP